MGDAQGQRDLINLRALPEQLDVDRNVVISSCIVCKKKTHSQN
jgi:hypothetical protein